MRQSPHWVKLDDRGKPPSAVRKKEQADRAIYFEREILSFMYKTFSAIVKPEFSNLTIF